MPKTATIYSTAEIIDLLGSNGTRQYVANLAKEQNWQRITGYTGDIEEYLWSRWRRQLAREMGVACLKLVTHDEWDKDDNCPVCGSFAIYRPATPEENNWPWRCIKGHSGNDKLGE